MNNKYIVLDIECIPNINLQDWAMKYVAKRIERKHKENRDPAKYCATTPEFGQIVCICTYVSGEDFFIYKGTEQEILSSFWNDLKDKIGYRIVGFNSKNFDIPYINKRSCINDIVPTMNIPTRRYDKSFHYDLMEVLSNFNSNDAHTLDIYCKMYGIDNENNTIDGNITGADILKLYISGNMEAIYEKCKNDVMATKNLYEKVKDYL